jgi:hemolysin D
LMSVTRLDRVVTSTSGKIAPVAGSLFIQTYDKAIIRQIMVRPGDIVHKGQVLATLDPTFATADFKQLKLAVASSQALVDRLQAERDGRPYFGGAGRYQALQLSLWHQRQAEYQAGVADFDARIRATNATIASAEADVDDYGKRVKIATRIETMRTTLERDGYGSKLNSELAMDTRVDLSRQLAESEDQVKQNVHNLASLEAQRRGYIEWWQDDLNKQLVQARSDLEQNERDLTKAQREHELIDVTAPREAIVTKVGDASVGSVVSPESDTTRVQSPLFTLNPLDGPLEADVDISAQDVGFVRVGDPVTIKLTAYDFIRYGTAKGVVKTISDDSFTLDDNQQPVDPYYRIRAAITEVKLRNVPKNFRLTPGMTLTADIKVGSRTLMSYLIDGALRTGSEAMREP